MKNIGIIGCGSRIRNVISNIQGVGDDIKIVALHDPSTISIAHTVKQFKLDDVMVYESCAELLADSNIDWVFIGSWNNAHAQQTIDAFAAGKNVFCEKPLATNSEDCLRVMHAWRESGRMFSMGFTLRYAPHYRKIKELLEDGRIGKIISLEFNETLEFNHGGYIHGNWRRLRENAGTHLLEKCCHDIDLINWFVGSKARRIASFGGCDFFTPDYHHRQKDIGTSASGETAYESWPDPWRENPFMAEKDIFDNQVAIIEFENKVRATFHTNCNTAIPERRLYICGTEGTLRADLLAGRIEICRIGWNTEIERISSGARDGHGGGDAVLGQSLRESIIDGEEPFTGVEDGLRSAFLVFAIDEACDRGNVVDMSSLWKSVQL